MGSPYNLRKAKSALKKFFKQADLHFEYKKDSDTLDATGYLKMRGIDDDIFTSVTYYKLDGNCVVNFMFDKIEENFESLNLVNEFNENIHNTLKAYIDDFLNFETEEDGIYPFQIADFVQSVFNNLSSDDALQLIRPLAKLTN